MLSELPSTPEPVSAEFAERFGYVDRVATLLDAQYRVPFTRIRFGWDAIVGLLPVVGDLLMAGVSLHLIVCARRLGADDRLAFRMVINLLVDTLVGAIPIIGSLFDIFFRANLRNFQLLLDHIDQHPQPGIPRSIQNP